MGYALATAATHRLAYRFPKRFVEIALGGLGVRLLFTLALVATVLVAVPLHRGMFIGTFAAVFAVGLAREVAALTRHRHEPPSSPV